MLWNYLSLGHLAGWDVIPAIPLRHHTPDIQFLNAARASYQSLEIRHRLQNQSREARKAQSDGFLYPSWFAASQSCLHFDTIVWPLYAYQTLPDCVVDS